MTYQPFGPPPLPCINCDRVADQHAGEQCLFQSTKYQPLEWAVLYDWCVRELLRRGLPPPEISEDQVTVLIADGPHRYKITCHVDERKGVQFEHCPGEAGPRDIG